MSEWKECKIGNIITLEYGKGLKGYKDCNGKYDVFGTNGKIGFTNEFLYDKSSVIIGRKGAYREVHLAKQPFFVIDTAFYTKIIIENLDNLFLYYWFKNIDINKMDSGSAIPSTSRDEVYELDILLPPLPEQRAIASVLSSFDDKIDLLHRQNKTLEAMAETLFRQWFVEEADEGREEIVITELFEVRDGTHDSPKQSPFGKPLITSKHIDTNRLDIKNAYLISENDFINVNKRSKVETNDILFSMIGTIGLTYLVQSETVDYAIKNIGLFKTSQNLDWRYYTFLWLSSSVGKEFIHEYRSGSTQEYIALGSLRSIVFDAPPKELLSRFNEVIHPYFDKIKTNMLQIQTLEKLWDTLLPKLMSGEVKVVN